MEPTADAPTPEQVEAAAKADADFNSKLVELIAEGKTDEEAREILGSIAPVPDRRAADQDAAIETAFAEGGLPEVDRRSAEKPSLPDVPLDPASFPSTGLEVGAGTTDPIEFPEPEASAEPEIPEKYHPVLHRIHDILDHLVKQIDPAEKILTQELRAILVDMGLRRPNK